MAEAASGSSHRARLEGLGLTATAGERVLYEALDLRVLSGETVVVRGRSGSGKSTLLRQLAGLDRIGDARLRLEGRAAEDLGWPAWRREVRYCAQRPALLPGSPAAWLDEVAAWATHEATPAAELRRRARERAAAWHVADDLWDTAWSSVSGGEAQRLHLAIQLAIPAQVYLLDEPTTALDERARDAVEQAFDTHTALWVTHDAAQANRVASRVLDLDAEAP